MNDLTNKYKFLQRGQNVFEAECEVCILGKFVCDAKKGLLDIEAHFETTNHTKNIQCESSLSRVITGKYACG
jgi:hypothetical protein